MPPTTTGLPRSSGWARIATEAKLIRRALLDRPPVQALLVRSTFARHALALGAAAPAGSSERRAAIAAATKHVRALRRGTIPIFLPSADMLDGAIAVLAGRVDDAIAHYRSAVAGLETCETFLYAHAVRFHLGALVGGDEGAAMQATTRAWLEREGVRKPERMLTMLLPVI